MATRIPRAARTVALCLVSASVPVLLGAFSQRRTGIEVLGQVFNLVLNKAVDSLPADAIYEKAARGLVEELGDPYAAFYTPKELGDFMRNSVGNSYGGLGMGVGQVGGNVVVTDVFVGTPAMRGGVERGDRILTIDGAATTGWTTDQVSQHLTGTIGTTVKVGFGRFGIDSPMVSTFTRAGVHAPAVPFAMMLRDSIGYVPLERFNATSGSEVAQAITSLRDKGASRIVIDLRGNGGGDVTQAVAVSNLFLTRGMEVATQRERGIAPKIYTASVTPAFPTLPIAVLIDESTASAWEIVAGALQDHDRAVVLGATSFGKGLVQSVYNLQDGYALKLTTGKWFTPSGRSIHRERNIVNGRLTLADSATQARDAGVATHSDAGRTLAANGGITPDVVLSAAPLTPDESKLLRALTPKTTEFQVALFELARAQRGKVRSDFAVTPALREELWSRLQAAGVTLDRDTWNAGASAVDRLLARQTLQMSLGDSAAVRRGAADDRVLAKALDLLGGAKTERDVYAGIGG